MLSEHPCGPAELKMFLLKGWSDCFVPHIRSPCEFPASSFNIQPGNINKQTLWQSMPLVTVRKFYVTATN